MNDDQLLRYSRQIMLPALEYEGQQQLLNSRVLIIGMGGLGAPVSMYLAAAGVGHMVIVDFDVVDLSNLQRQIIHTTQTIGQPKTDSAWTALNAINPDIRIDPINQMLEGDELLEQVKQADVVVDASDNFSTRFALNKVCRATATPLVSGAAIRMEGQVSVFSGQPGDPCYRCLYPEEGQVGDSCSENGVLAPVVGIIGSIQATEAIKVLTGMGSTLVGKLMILDALHMQWRTLKLKPDPRCPVCNGENS
ncbi:MAG: molybdopterin-synthase adenylyltransferase MoeB [Candidatus Polarisedimenticolaceae bacterium]|nr:molybdopterin-synthase adenylyltransferase MoeB [Candidatus Polarisedimenticolaceae bacterium]